MKPLTEETAIKLFTDKCAEYDLPMTQSYSGRHPYLEITAIKGLTKRFCVVEDDYMVLTQVVDNRIFAVDLNTNSMFVSVFGKFRASTSHIKIPIAFRLWANRDTPRIPEFRFKYWADSVTDKPNTNFYNAHIKILSNATAVNDWFARFVAEIPHWREQEEMCKNAIKYIENAGCEYKQILKRKSRFTDEWKTAFDAYQKLYLQQIQKIVKRDEILCESRNFA